MTLVAGFCVRLIAGGRKGTFGVYVAERDKVGESKRPADMKNNATNNIATGNVRVGTQTGMVIGEVVVAGTLGPLVTAFCTELGKRLGGTTADWIARVHIRRRTNSPAKSVVVVEADPVATVIDVDEDLSREARLALFDLDVQSDAVRGRHLKWDSHAAAWVPVDTAG